ncbi:hypothetical protein C6Y11_07865 [Lactiplantibacillus pentosus]|nr:hypothetical protein [Lactiplantibacillus pentosus]MCT3302010.1 hypothetical protein [Lactiplantibacillus pentosus]PRO80184.1 hypothetical protein C6Y11_07865 [Lactiplantibacillus pentosus]PRO82947.1 hypothetical protein C6Y09_03435 [Lactiplantibacillus pentosus]PRO93864.1 hypothetical protein C6Y12_00770 [Lactiplantibacillus pentosus]
MRQSTPVKKCLTPVFDGYLGYARFKISLLVATSITATNQPKKTASLRLTTAVKLFKNHPSHSSIQRVLTRIVANGF